MTEPVSPAPSTLRCLESAYMALLQLPHDSVRLKNQPTLCALRDSIASYRGLDGEAVQNEYEERALRVRTAPSETGDRNAAAVPRIVCHSPNERCLACPHYYGKAPVCSYAPAAAPPSSTRPINNDLTRRIDAMHDSVLNTDASGRPDAGLFDTWMRLKEAIEPVSARGEKFTVREKAMMRQALSLLLADEIQGEKAGDREAAESAQAKL